MVDFQTSQPVTFFRVGVCLSYPGIIVCKCKKVTFSFKAHWIDWSHKIHVYKLVWPLGSTLRLAVINFCCFSLLVAVTDEVFRIIDVGNI